MMKYPIGIQSFEKIREDGFVYVDKTEMIYSLVHDGTIYFLSRPRRFGKSLLISTLENYFLGRRELFRGLAIESLEKEWAEYPVFHIDFNGSNFTDPGSLDKKLEWYVSMWEDIFGKTDKDIGIGNNTHADCVQFGGCRIACIKREKFQLQHFRMIGIVIPAFYSIVGRYFHDCPVIKLYVAPYMPLFIINTCKCLVQVIRVLVKVLFRHVGIDRQVKIGIRT